MRHTMRASVAMALLLALAWPGQGAAKKNAPPETIEWVAPWREGMVLRYATASDDVAVSTAGKKRSRTTGIETLRITAAHDAGFVQEWTFADARYEQLEGGSEHEALVRRALDALPDIALEVDLDAAGNFVRLRNLDQLVEVMRAVLLDVFHQAFESGVQAAGGSVQAGGGAVGADARARAAAIAERMTAPDVLGAQLSRDAVAYNDLFGAVLQAGVPMEVDVEIESPLGLGLVPARVSLAMTPGAPGSDEATLEWSTRMDRERAAEVVMAAVERMYGPGVGGDGDPGQLAGMAIIDSGHARFRRSTGVPLMVETLRTIQVAGEQRIERRRMRLLDDPHGHDWPDDGEPRPAAAP